MAASSSVFKDDIMKGRGVLITGGGTGIGFGIATVFGTHGAKVSITGRRLNVLEEACEKLRAKGIEAYPFQCDVRDPEKCIQVAKGAKDAMGGIDVLVNNAAGNFFVAAEDLTPNGMKTVMEIDLMGTFHMCKACLPYLKESGKSVILNTSATLYYKAFPFQLHASAAKASIDVLTNVIGVEWAEYGIRTVSIAPGPIADTVGGIPTKQSSKEETGRVFSSMGALSSPDDKNAIRRVVPIGRLGTIEDIGYTCLFVASDAGSFINATTIVVDGGNWHDASGTYLAIKKRVNAQSQAERENFKGGVRKSKL